MKLEILVDENKELKNDLQQLKNCQLQYFILSVTSTAALLGLSSIFKEFNFVSIAVLSPLFVILPCWWIFFDKATSITRIVGYCRFLEKIIIKYPNLNKYYIGYENALDLYRESDDNELHDSPEYIEFKKYKTNHKHDNLSIRHKYWTINWYTFLTLSSFSGITSLVFSFKHHCIFLILSVFSIILIILTAIFTYLIRKKITKGKYSYSENTIFWEFILSK